MYKRLFFKNIILTSILSIILIIFISLTISLNYNTQVDETAYTHYLNLPFYFKLIFITFIPIFSDYNYLYQFIMLYFLLIISIYTIYLAKRKKESNILLPISKVKQTSYLFLANYLPLLVVILISFLTLLITSICCYKQFYITNIIGLINTILYSFILFISFYQNDKESKLFKWFKLIILIYSIILFILNINFSNLYYFSPFNILIEANNSFLAIILFIILSILFSIFKILKI